MDIITSTGAYTSSDVERGTLVKLTGTTAQAISLVTALGDKWAQTFENANTGATLAANACTMTPTSGTVDGAGTLVTYAGERRTVICDGTNWETKLIGLIHRFDGVCAYIKNLNAADQVLRTEQWAINTADLTCWTSPGTYPGNNTLFPYLIAANDALTIQAATRYGFEAVITLTSSGTTSHNLQFGFGGTATFTDIAYHALASSGASSGPNNAEFTVVAVATASAIASAAAVANMRAYVRGQFNSNAAGTIIPSLAVSANPTGTILTKKGCSFRIWPMAAASTGSVGAWT